MSGALWESICAAQGTKVCIEVPEWTVGGQPWRGYAHVATVADEAAVRQHVADASSPLTWARLTYNKLLSENGEREFAGVGFADFQNRVPGWLSQRIGQQIYTGTASDSEAAEGN